MKKITLSSISYLDHFLSLEIISLLSKPEETAFQSVKGDSVYVWICSGLFTRSAKAMISFLHSSKEGECTSSSIVLSDWTIKGLSIIFCHTFVLVGNQE